MKKEKKIYLMVIETAQDSTHKKKIDVLKGFRHFFYFGYFFSIR